ncbi:hypothetical protein JCM5296_001166 [Sporobolomyces johnsonii]
MASASPCARPPEAGPSKSFMNRMSGPSDLKAGLGGMRTAEEVQRIIYETSKGSKYFHDQQRRDKEVEARGNRLKALLASRELTANGREEEEVDRILEELEEKRDLSRVIALIDADAFYANVHEREDKSLAGKAFGVGGGMLTTASYEARKYGCRSAMPLFVAKKLCPHLISLKLEPKLYVAASREIMAVLEKYGPISPASLDEAYVDMTDYCDKEQVSPSEAISRLRQEVFSTTGLTVSAGVSPNKALSKICADLNKPNGQFIVDPTAEACMAFIKDVRLRRCHGIGRVTETVLNAIGFETVGDLYTKRSKLYLVRDHLGSKGVFKWLLSLYLGLGSNRVVRAQRGDRKTYGVEKTFNPTNDRDVLDDILRRVAKSLAKDLARSEFSGRTLTLRIKHDNFESITRAHTPGKNIYIQSFKDIYRWGLMLLHKEMDDRRAALARGEKVKGGTSPVLKARLLGLRVGNLRDERKEKTNKIDGWFAKSSTSKNPKEEELGDSDDESGIERYSDESGEEDAQGEEDGLKRQLEQLKQAALAPDPSLEEAGEDDDADDSARWQCVDEWEILAEAAPKEKRKQVQGAKVWEELVLEDTDDEEQTGWGRPPSIQSPKASTSTSNAPRPHPAGSSTASSSSKLASPPASPKRKSPEPSTSTSTSMYDASRPSKKAKKKKKSTAASPPPPPPNPHEFTCPVCAKVLYGSETAMNGHVASHFEEPVKGKKGARWR